MLACRELKNYLEICSEPLKSADLAGWQKKDAKANAMIGSNLANEHPEHVGDANTVYDMGVAIKSIFQVRTPLNRLNFRRKFYSQKKTKNEKVNSKLKLAKQ